jgi:hypothetical protein
LKDYLHIPPYKRLSCGKHLVEQSKNALAFDFGEGFPHGPADNRPANQLLIGSVSQHEPMVRAVKQRGEAWRLRKDVPKPDKFFCAVHEAKAGSFASLMPNFT